MTEAVLATAERVLPDLRAHVVHAEASTPVTHERFTLAWGGSALGLAPERRLVPGRRLGAATPLPGLFLTGVTLAPVPGVAGALDAGAATAGAVLGRDLRTMT